MWIHGLNSRQCIGQSGGCSLLLSERNGDRDYCVGLYLVVHFSVPALGELLVLFEGLAALYQEFGGFGGNNGIRWYGFEYQCHASYFTTFADGDRSEDGCSYANGYVIFNGGM